METKEAEGVDIVPKQEPTQFVGGEIHIIADSKTGAISVNAPQNILVALGIIETAKTIIIQQHQENLRKAMPPTILRAQSSDLSKLRRPS